MSVILRPSVELTGDDHLVILWLLGPSLEEPLPLFLPRTAT